MSSPSSAAEQRFEMPVYFQHAAVSMRAQLPCIAGAICLRALRDDDLAAFLGYRSDAQVARYQGWWPMDETKARTFLREQGASAHIDSAGHWLQLAIADAFTDALVGDLGVWMLNDSTEAELGITIAPTSQGMGVGRSAMRAALALLFADAAVTRVRANADARNTPSRRMLVAAGFRETGTADVLVKEEPCVECHYLVERGHIPSIPAPSIPEGDLS
jgi:RimJ/RimL family protein N-acetyltransferase